MQGNQHTDHASPRPPAGPTHADSLPDALTFFVTRAQRRAILRTLRATDPDRTRALLRRVLGEGGCAHA